MTTHRTAVYINKDYKTEFECSLNFESVRRWLAWNLENVADENGFHATDCRIERADQTDGNDGE